MALETFPTPCSVEVCIAVPGLCIIGLIHDTKTCPGLIRITNHMFTHLCSPALSYLHLHFQEKEVLANRPEECYNELYLFLDLENNRSRIP